MDALLLESVIRELVFHAIDQNEEMWLTIDRSYWHLLSHESVNDLLFFAALRQNKRAIKTLLYWGGDLCELRWATRLVRDKKFLKWVTKKYVRSRATSVK